MASSASGPLGPTGPGSGYTGIGIGASGVGPVAAGPPSVPQMIRHHAAHLERYLPAWVLALMPALHVGLETHSHSGPRVAAVFAWVEVDVEKRLPIAISVLRLLEGSSWEKQDKRIDELLETSP